LLFKALQVNGLQLYHELADQFRARRLVIGNAGEIYYTDDHYLTFQKISEQYD